MQKRRKRVIEVLVASLIVVMGASLVLADTKTAEDKVAVVNGTVITKLDFDVELNRAQQQFARSGQPVSDAYLAEIKKDVLENLINRELLFQESHKKGINIDEAIIDKELGALKGRFPNEEEFKKALSEMNLSESNVKTEIRRGIAVQQFVDKEFGGKITISDEDSRSYFDNNTDSFKQPEQVCASHILIKADAEGEESKEARKKIKEIRKKLKKGEDFGTLAEEFSTCPSSTKGGDLGCFGRGQMVKPFEEAAFALEPGKVSDIVETRFGYHLIKVTEKKPAGTMAYEDVKERLQQYLKQEQIQKELDTYVENLKKEGKIERFLPEGP